MPTAQELDAAREEAGRHGYGIDNMARLPGNVGYLELRGFGPTELVGDALSAAMTVLSGTDALILDLRRNGGGEPNTVAYLMSHFFAHGDERHLNDLYSRATDTTRQYWTSPAVATRYTKPVYVLTSKRTFSGGEECAYDFQTQKRGVIVGESTGGGSNPGDMYPVGAGFAAFIPDGRAINPITKTNWEHVGVKPDIAVPAADAKKVAHAAILRGFIKAAPGDAGHVTEKPRMRCAYPGYEPEHAAGEFASTQSEHVGQRPLSKRSPTPVNFNPTCATRSSFKVRTTSTALPNARRSPTCACSSKRSSNSCAAVRSV